ncbi:MAG TPA: hypothetical protein VLX32_05140 [Candidatus Acidoferrum sp.]|nr:hypothetical protein [Candidatus Acidoferrum sp.]
MSTSPSSVAVAHDPAGTRLKLRVSGALFELIHLIPRLLEIRRSKSSWLAFRVAMGMLGAGLVVLPLGLGLGNNFILALPILGLGLFILAILLPPALDGVSDKDKAQELGALIVVDGGDYKRGSVLGYPAKIYVGVEQVWVLDPHHQDLLTIPVEEIASANAEETGGKWSLRICWGRDEAIFAYDGVFAEYLAHVAQGALRGVMRLREPVKAKSRAASA